MLGDNTDGGTRNRNTSKRVATGPSGHWDLQKPGSAVIRFPDRSVRRESLHQLLYRGPEFDPHFDQTVASRYTD